MVDEVHEQTGLTPDRILEFLGRETIKTIRRPIRLIAIPWSYLLLLIGRCKFSPITWLMVPVFCHVAPYWDAICGHTADALAAVHIIHSRRRPSPRRALLYYHAGCHLLQRSRPRRAWYHFERCLRGTTDPHHFFVAAVCLLHGLGRARDALSCFARANELNLQRARTFGEARTRYRVLDNFWTGNIGHTAALDYVIKLGCQEGRSRDDTILYLAPRSLVANRCLLEQFRPHLTLIEHPSELPFEEAAVPALRYDFVWPLKSDGCTVHLWEVAAETYRGRP